MNWNPRRQWDRKWTRGMQSKDDKDGGHKCFLNWKYFLLKLKENSMNMEKTCKTPHGQKPDRSPKLQMVMCPRSLWNSNENYKKQSSDTKYMCGLRRTLHIVYYWLSYSCKMYSDTRHEIQLNLTADDIKYTCVVY